ncbi:MAG: SAM-dependent methyltransferase [Ilumatobacteraceae bacterium]
MAKDWIEWHSEYDDPDSALSERRRQVTTLIRKSLDGAARGPVRILSLCAGNARDLADALRDHPRRTDVTGGVVELDRQLADESRTNLEAAGGDIDVIVGDAGNVDTFGHLLPVDLLLLVGIFGNVPDGEVETITRAVPAMCHDGANVIWTRHRRLPDLTPSVRRWFDAAGCTALDFISPGTGKFSVGRERVKARTAASRLPNQLFRFQDR